MTATQRVFASVSLLKHRTLAAYNMWNTTDNMSSAFLFAPVAPVGSTGGDASRTCVRDSGRGGNAEVAASVRACVWCACLRAGGPATVLTTLHHAV